MNIDRRLAESHCQADLAVVIFPVYCQNIPAVVRDFFSKLDSKHVVLIATYGKISHGNVLWEAFKIIRGRVIAAAYVPMGHTYLDSSTQFDAQPLQPIFARIQHPRAATLTRESKHPLASFFPSWRSRCGVRIWLDESCNAPLLGYYQRRQAQDARTAGNGRLARNTLEKAIFHQSRRLVAEPAAELDVILPSDLELQ